MVLLTCLVDYFFKCGANKIYFNGEEEAKHFLFDELKISDRIRGKESDIMPLSDDKFALWRVKEREIVEYTTKIKNFLTPRVDNDFVVSVYEAAQEMYYNVVQHAEANDTAFSYVYYDKERIYVAVCDFGIGIAKSMRKKYQGNDVELISLSMDKGVSVKSTQNNQGMGLYTLSTMIEKDDTLRVISNNGFIFIKGENKKNRPLGFDFKGTFIYFDIKVPSEVKYKSQDYKFDDYGDDFFK